MNQVCLMGRLTREPKVLYSASGTAVASYTLAVDRRKKGEADFINIKAFGQGAEFAEKYLRKGTKIALSGRIQTGSYTDKAGNKVYTTEVIADNQEFAETKGETKPETKADDFLPVPDMTAEELPFN